MRLTRNRRRRRLRRCAATRVAQSAGRLLLPMALLAAIASPGQPQPTFARLTDDRTAGAAQVRALSAAEALAVSAAVADLGDLTADSPVAQVALRVQNRSGRALPLTVSLSGASGLSAGISQQWLPPGETALVAITGRVAEAGTIEGRVRISAFGEFLVLEVPLRAQVHPAPAPEPTAGTDPARSEQPA